MIAFIFALLVVAATAQNSKVCQMPGNAICKSVDLPGYAFRPCCPGFECLPWTGRGYVDGAEPDYFCQFSQPIAVGGDCRKQKGSCAEGSSCLEGVCAEDAAARKWRFL
eukprot:TRINITY_DN496_c0_g1_i1.p1 TRINITY_DN496_c0_g1~~TRINITY_DN496_c0_g1_i1.p1  ORF type:complete len:109 (-),score=34.82 TRINITY_DN496_c0_g1_i1:6-332(-)